MNNKDGFFMVIEGVNGCGKRKVAKSIGEFLESENKKGFDLEKHWKNTLDFPEPEDLGGYDFFLSAEPTHALVGRAIRKEMFYMNNREYDEISMLNAYALDRHILYKRLLVPLRDKGKTIIQERTLSSTLAIQTVGDTAVGWDEVLNHPDHQYVLENLPDVMVIVNIDPERAQEFMNGRSAEEDDNDKYENLQRQKKMIEIYKSEKFRKEFEDRGVKIEYIDNDGSLELLGKRSVEVFRKYR